MKNHHEKHVQAVLELFHFKHIDSGKAMTGTLLKAHERGEMDLTEQVSAHCSVTKAEAGRILNDATAEICDAAK